MADFDTMPSKMAAIKVESRCSSSTPACSHAQLP